MTPHRHWWLHCFSSQIIGPTVRQWVPRAPPPTLDPSTAGTNERLHPFLCQRFSPHPSSFPTMFPILLVYPASCLPLKSGDKLPQSPLQNYPPTPRPTRTHAARCQEVAPAWNGLTSCLLLSCVIDSNLSSIEFKAPRMMKHSLEIMFSRVLFSLVYGLEITIPLFFDFF